MFLDLAFPLAALLLTRQVLSFFLPSLFLGITGLKSGGSRSRKAVQDFGLHRSHEEFLFDTLLIKSFMCFGVITLNLNLNQDQWHGHRWLSPPAASRAACPSSTALPARPATHHDPSQATPIAGAPSWTSGMVTKGMTATAMILQQWLVSETNSLLLPIRHPSSYLPSIQTVAQPQPARLNALFNLKPRRYAVFSSQKCRKL